ncbi:MAG: PilZ domain-containing protein [Phycisphaerae bacterium]
MPEFGIGDTYPIAPSRGPAEPRLCGRERGHGTAMNPSFLERRSDPRTHAFVPVTMHYHGTDEGTPAHLLDLSAGGAGLLTTSYNAPKLGQHLDVNFETANTDGGTELPTRREVGVVVNLRHPERGIARVGVRFIEHPDMNCGLFDPIDTLTSIRKSPKGDSPLRRWETARNFDRAFGSTAQGAY